MAPHATMSLKEITNAHDVHDVPRFLRKRLKDREDHRLKPC